VKIDTIREHWGEILRLVASLKAGHVAPSAMLRKLAAYERQNQVDLGLQEIGRIERTFFMLDWLENPDLRRRCQAGLNKSEQRHVLTQAICTFRQGRIIDRTHETLQYRASGLNLVIAAIVYWNSTYNVRLHYSNQALWTARAGCKQTNVRGYLAGMSELNRRGKKATKGEGVSAFVSGAPALSRHRGIRPAARNRRPNINRYLW
jgi:hypothetical protein